MRRKQERANERGEYEQCEERAVEKKREIWTLKCVCVCRSTEGRDE